MSDKPTSPESPGLLIETDRDWCAVVTMLEHVARGLDRADLPNHFAALHLRCAILEIVESARLQAALEREVVPNTQQTGHC